MTVTWTSAVEVDAVVAAVRTVKTAVVVVIAIIARAVSVVVPPVIAVALLTVLLHTLRRLLVGSGSDSSTHCGATSHTNYGSNIMATPATTDAADGRTQYCTERPQLLNSRATPISNKLIFFIIFTLLMVSRCKNTKNLSLGKGIFPKKDRGIPKTIAAPSVGKCRCGIFYYCV